MTLHEFSEDIVPIIQLGFAAFGLVSLLLVWWQIRQTNRWNKLQFRQTFLSQHHYELEAQVIRAAKEAGVDLKARRAPLTNDEIAKIWSNDKAYDAVTSLLNDLEVICTAVNVGAADSDVAYELHSDRIVRGFHVYAPLIESFIKHHEDEALFSQLRLVAKKWKKRAQHEQEKRESLKRQHQHELGKSGEMKSKV